MRLDPEILDRAPDEGARVVALALCAAADEAAGRLGEHGEALHDFRVALRRLRSALRAFRGILRGAVPRDEERRLRDLARATGPARDAEVLLAWLRAQDDGLVPAGRAAAAWFAARVERARGEGRTFVEKEVAPVYRDLSPDLVRGLAAGGEAPAAPATPETFGAALAALLRAQARAVREAAAAVAGPGDVARVHLLRIEAKRLRYLLEPLRENTRADTAPAVRGLKKLQEVLGQLHDAHVARAEAASALVVAAAERSRQPEPGHSLRPGLLALEAAARARAEERYAVLDAEWLSGGLTSVLDQVFEVVASLEFRDAEVEEAAPERRLLLSALPEEGRGEVEELEQGWLPAERLRESVGAVRGSGGERWFRSTSQGRGAARVEAVEEMGRDDFEAYWPLTEGRRIRKRRHRPGAAAGWCFDEYLDRRLVLAVAVEGGGAELPAWLEPLVVRDVTGERAYADETLARKRRG
jgi:CHAD domain-containing protein